MQTEKVGVSTVSRWRKSLPCETPPRALLTPLPIRPQDPTDARLEPLLDAVQEKIGALQAGMQVRANPAR